MSKWTLYKKKMGIQKRLKIRLNVIPYIYVETNMTV